MFIHIYKKFFLLLQYQLFITNFYFIKIKQLL